MRLLNKILKVICVTIAALVLLVCAAAASLYIPAVQNFVVGKVAAYASEKTGMRISMRRVLLTWPLDLRLEGAQAIQGKDTLFAARDFIASVKLRPLFRSQVVLDRARLIDAKVNTLDLVKACRVSGKVGDLDIRARNIALKRSAAVVNEVSLAGADLKVVIPDSVPPDTTPSQPVLWRILAQKVRIVDSRVSYTGPDSAYMHIEGRTKEMEMRNGYFDLAKALYKADALRIDSTDVRFDGDRFQPMKRGIDPMHLFIQGLCAEVDSFQNQGVKVRAVLRSFSMAERCGLRVREAKGRFEMDSLFFHIPDFMLRTENSYLSVRTDLNTNALLPAHKERMWGRMFATLGKQDLLSLAGDRLPKEAARYIPNEPVILRMGVDGNLSDMTIAGMQVEASRIGWLQASGRLKDVLSEKRSGTVNFRTRLKDLSFYTKGMGLKEVMIPRNIRLEGQASFSGSLYKANLQYEENGSRVDLDGQCDLDKETYQAKAGIRNLQITHYIKNDSLRTFSGDVAVRGEGFNPLSPRTKFHSEASVHQFNYGRYDARGLSWKADMQNGRLRGDVRIHNDYLLMGASVRGTLRKKFLYGNVNLNVYMADLKALHLQDSASIVGGKLAVDLLTDLKNRHRVRASLYDTYMTVPQGTFYPLDWNVLAFTLPDSAFARVSAGDMHFRMESRNSMPVIVRKAKEFTAELMRQQQNKELDQPALKRCLPDMNLDFSSGHLNPLNRILRQWKFDYDTLTLGMRTSSERGIFAKTEMFGGKVSEMQLDTVRAYIIEGKNGVVNLYGQVKNGPKNPQYVFESVLKGVVNQKGIDLFTTFYDRNRVKGMETGINVNFMDDGLMLKALNQQPILAYQRFEVNPDNYVYIDKENHVRANLRLTSEEGTGFALTSNNDTTAQAAQQDVTLTLHKVDVGKVLATMPYLPNMGGILEGDVRFIQRDNVPSFNAQLAVNDFKYEGTSMGNIASNLIYVPKEDGTHVVNGEIMRNDETVMTLDGGYKTEGNGQLNANLTMVDFPLDMANAFIPDNMTSVAGKANGTLSLKGNPDKPEVNGVVDLDSMTVRSALFSLNYRLPKRTVEIKDNVLSLKDIQMYGTGDSPLRLNGTVDFRDLDRIKPDLTVGARNFAVLNARRTLSSVLYGKVFVNLYSRLTGTMNNLRMNGGVQVLGNTDVTYVLQDTPLTVEDRLSGLVTFKDFNAARKAQENPDRSRRDSTAIAQPQPDKFMGVNMSMTLSVEQGAQIKCDLSANQNSYVNLEGGGDLRMKYTSDAGLSLTGRYTLNNGEMKYELPVIPLKTFTITNGSYIEFFGDPMNPTLNISAKERTRALVGGKGEAQRSVNFDVGVAISQTLEKMGLAFTLEAPDDASVQQELSAMTPEERGKLAVTMLSTGMYMGGSGGFDMNNALNVFLQNEISNITGNALKSVDLSVGMENNKDESGANRTDYSFKFSKRFWGNRLIVNIGGTVSSGNNTNANQEESLINDVSVEYRLDNSGTRYVRLYHVMQYDDLLDGNVQVTGAGFVLRKKMTRFGELFIFRKRNRSQNIPAGSMRRTK